MLWVRYELSDDKQELPFPAEYSWSYEDLDKNSGRNDNALMLRERIGQKTKLTLRWNTIADNQRFSKMVKLLKETPEYFYITYPDPDGSTYEIECYHGPMSTAMSMYRKDHITWKDFSCNIVER